MIVIERYLSNKLNKRSGTIGRANGVEQHVEQEEQNNNFEQVEHITTLKLNTTKQTN